MIINENNYGNDVPTQNMTQIHVKTVRKYLLCHGKYSRSNGLLQPVNKYK